MVFEKKFPKILIRIVVLLVKPGVMVSRHLNRLPLSVGITGSSGFPSTLSLYMGVNRPPSEDFRLRSKGSGRQKITGHDSCPESINLYVSPWVSVTRVIYKTE